MWPNPEYKLVLLKKTADKRFVHVKQLGIDIAKNEKLWRKQTYYYNAEDISYSKGRKSFIFKDIDSGNTVFRWGQSNAVASPVEPGAETFKGLVRMALTSIGGEYGLVLVVMAGIAGIVGGLLLGISPVGNYFRGNQTAAAVAATLLGVI